MSNAYATPTELKAAIPDGVRSTVTKYDALMLRLLSGVSRWIDRELKRVFYPTVATKKFFGSGTCYQRVPDLLSVTTIEYSLDYGATYTALTSNDYILTVEYDENSLESYTVIMLDQTSTALAAWPNTQRGVRITGVWGYAENRDAAFESANDVVKNTTQISASDTSLKVADVDGLDIYGALVRFQGGQILKIGSEYLETGLTIDTSANTIVVSRGRNGSTAAIHLADVPIYVWRAPEPVRDAVIIQAVRQMERGFQGFGDARSQPDVGQMFWFKSLDPEAVAKLATYRNLSIP